MIISDKVAPRRPQSGAQGDDLDSYGEGEPIETALTAPLAEVVACTEDTARISEQLTTPEVGPEERKRLARPQNQGQAERAALNASNLGRAPEIALGAGVEAGALLDLCDKRSALLRGRRGGLLVQGDAADGKLLIGSLFRFLAAKVDGAVSLRLQRLPQDGQERRDLLADQAEIAALRAEIARKGPEGRADNDDAVARLATELQAARDEVDYLTMQRQIAEGQAPDTALLGAAARHSERAAEAAVRAEVEGRGADKDRSRRDRRR